MTVTGRMIADGLRPGAEFAPPATRIVKMVRVDVGDSAGPGQPRFWTIVDFESGDGGAVAAALAESLDTEGGWYADFADGDDHVVVFAGKVFRYAPDDRETYAAAVAYGRSVGVPEHQLDWEG
ncbi:hypothetical protein JIG36_02095 [Actinoplanes sp. LDG1-06]|uniref:Uncharacterized protein n=1 Tax=Paractinoplanes ovalisporus TaxID=2810368 RepID=A0ABS2A3D2_9ACTN|nr:hypothetical protein [Actinoplanes ovalisporus]MBM2614347.1 hypothetical protein [Actinoplanes ovalisporus]